MEFEASREQLLHAHNLEKEELTSRADKRIEQLQEEVVKVQKDRDEALLLAENDRQQVRNNWAENECKQVRNNRGESDCDQMRNNFTEVGCGEKLILPRPS